MIKRILLICALTLLSQAAQAAGNLVNAAVLIVPVRAGEIIHADMVEYREVRPITSIIMNENELIGKQARTTLRAGVGVSRNQVRMPYSVLRNRPVTVRYVNHGMVMTIQGRALDNGAKGELIRVQNTKSNKIVDAVVMSSSVVQINGDRM
ncbi:MAG: flagellar basal body P-ring formation chaperone FlgA [Alphaproteobacteria bacterium]|nr:flagellar basal body P-ring formation chaperone FlgA [Alphaproteobacteria bacterium]